MKPSLIAGLSFVILGLLLPFFWSSPLAIALGFGLMIGGTLGTFHTLRR